MRFSRIFVLSILIIIFSNIALKPLNWENKSEDYYLKLKFSFPTENLLNKDIYLYRASYFTLDSYEDIFISDERGNRVLKFGSSGQFLAIIGRKGQGPGEFQGPHNVMSIKDFIIVHDRNNLRLQFFNREGKYKKSVKLYKRYRDMAISADGLIFAVPIHKNNAPLIDVLTLDGNLLNSFGMPLEFKKDSTQLNDVNLDLNEKGEVFLAFEFFPIVRRYSQEGKLIAEYSIENKRMKKRGDDNRTRYKKNLSKNMRTRLGYWIIINAIRTTEEGFYLLNCHPDILILKFDNLGELKTSYHYKPENGFYSRDFLIKNQKNNELFYVLQMKPENRVDVFEVYD